MWTGRPWPVSSISARARAQRAARLATKAASGCRPRSITSTPRGGASGWWLTARYEGRWVWFGDHNPDLPLGDTRALLMLGWRHYDTNWARVGLPWH